MTILDWHPAPYEAHGSTAGEGATRLLGRPRLDPLTVLMRETLQNAWDARSGDSVSFRVELRTLSRSQLDLLRGRVFAHGAENVLCASAETDGHEETDKGLLRALQRDELRVLEISDRRTVGLRGPLRADLDPDEGQPTDFIDFVFNLGAPRSTRLGGGTYGFGKTISYITSRARTVLVGTRTQHFGDPQYRFIGSSIGHQWAKEGRRFTGRHWWGRAEDGRIGPVVGQEATNLMEGLGFPPFRSDGTSLLIIDPDLQGRDLRTSIDHLVEAFVWHLWPKLIHPPGKDTAPVEPEFLLEGQRVEVPDPRQVSGLSPFVDALQAVRQHDLGEEVASGLLLPPTIRTIDYGSQRRPLGSLALVKSPAPWRREEPNGEFEVRPFNGPSHHVALMRQAELVVEYLEGPELSIPGYEWAGVFRSLPSVDDDFAASEPPAHDSWEWQSVADKRAKSHVRTAVRKLRAEMRSYASPAGGAGPPGSGESVAGLADRLRSLVPTLAATAPSPRPSTNGGGAARTPRLQVDLVGARPFYDGEHVVRVDAQISASTGGRARLAINAGVQTDTGVETEPPVGAAAPRIRSVTIAGSRLQQDDDGEWPVLVPDGGCAAEIEVASSEQVALQITASARRETEGESH